MNIRCVRAQLVPLLTVATLLLSVRAIGQSPFLREGDDATSPDTVTTDWGPESDGLQLRVTSSRTYNYLEPISVSIQIRAVDNSDVTRILRRDSSANEPSVRLRLVDLQNGISHDYTTAITSWNPRYEDSTSSAGRSEFDLVVICNVAGVPGPVNAAYGPFDWDNRESLFEWETEWDSASTQPPISGHLPGRYSARAEILIPPGEADSWHGLMISPQFDLEIVDESAKPDTVKFIFPRRLTLERGPILCADTGSFDTISVVVAPHFTTLYRISGNVSRAYLPGLPRAPVVMFSPDELRSYIPAPGITLTLPKGPAFEDGEAVMRFEYELYQLFYLPGKRHYRARAQLRKEVLWKGSVEAAITRSEYESMTVPDWELYDHHTLLIPHEVRLRDGREIEFDKDSLLPMGVRVSKGSGFLTTVTMDNQLVHQYSGLPVSPLLELPEIMASNSKVSVNVSIYEQLPTSDRISGDTLRDDNKVWSGDFILTNVGDEFEITSEERREAPVVPSYRRYEIPRNLILTDDLEVYGDTTNPIIVELEKLPDDIILGMLECESQWAGEVEFNALIPTGFRGLLATFKYPTIDNDSITCELSLYNARRGDDGFWFNVVPNYHYPILWKKAYRIPVTEKQAKRIDKQVREWHKRYGGH